MRLLPPTVDRQIAEAIAYKRIVTGGIALAAGVAVGLIVLAHGATPLPLVVLTLAIFFGGGAWTLLDGLRLRRELRR